MRKPADELGTTVGQFWGQEIEQERCREGTVRASNVNFTILAHGETAIGLLHAQEKGIQHLSVDHLVSFRRAEDRDRQRRGVRCRKMRRLARPASESAIASMPKGTEGRHIALSRLLRNLVVHQRCRVEDPVQQPWTTCIERYVARRERFASFLFKQCIEP